MSEKRRGLGRGLAALIPTSSEQSRPVDVFFPGGAEPATLDPLGSGPENAPAKRAGLGEEAQQALQDAAARRRGGPSARKPSGTTATGRNTGGSAPTVPSAEAPSHSPAADSTGAPERKRAAQGGALSEVSASSRSAQAQVDDGLGLVPVPGASFAEIPVGLIRPNSRQPRTAFNEDELSELVASITEVGVLQPIVVRPAVTEPGTFELIMGERRWRATQEAGLTTVPAIIRETEDDDLLRDALLENLHRSALNPLEEAAAYQQLLDDFGCTHEVLATRLARSRPQISNTLRLLKLPALVQRRVAAGVLSAGHARALLGLQDAAAIERLAQRIVAEGLSVRATEEIVSMGGLDSAAPARRRIRAGSKSAAVEQLATRLSDRFETRVRVDVGKSRGKVTIEFASVEDLNRILDVMVPDDPGLLRKD